MPAFCDISASFQCFTVTPTLLSSCTSFFIDMFSLHLGVSLKSASLSTTRCSKTATVNSPSAAAAAGRSAKSHRTMVDGAPGFGLGGENASGVFSFKKRRSWGAIVTLHEIQQFSDGFRSWFCWLDTQTSWLPSWCWVQLRKLNYVGQSGFLSDKRWSLVEAFVVFCHGIQSSQVRNIIV